MQIIGLSIRNNDLLKKQKYVLKKKTNRKKEVYIREYGQI